MEKSQVLKMLALIFMILTCIGGGYVILHRGEVNPGYAIIPSLFSIIFSQCYLKEKKKDKNHF